MDKPLNSLLFSTMDYSCCFFGCDRDDHHQVPPPQPSPKKELQLQGPRPTPLRVSKESHAIRKPPPRHPPAPIPKPPPPPATDEDPCQPVIIYAVSPKVIHVEESHFMSLVQRLTGLSPSGPQAGDVSPAARFASIEKASPKHRPNQATTSSAVEGFDLAASRGSVPVGILSPAPSSLLAIPSWFFSPEKDSPAVPLFQDLITSPLLQGGSGFIGGSSWFSSSMISPSPTSLDLYNLFSDC